MLSALSRRLVGWFPRRRVPTEPAVLIGDPRVDDWETVSTSRQATALAWRDQLRGMGVDAKCAADHPLDRLVAATFTSSSRRISGLRASEIMENLD